MSDVQANIDKLLDSQFLTGLLELQSDEGCIAGHTTGLYLNDDDLDTFRPLLDPANDHANVGQIGCYRGTPVRPPIPDRASAVRMSDETQNQPQTKNAA